MATFLKVRKQHDLGEFIRQLTPLIARKKKKYVPDNERRVLLLRHTPSHLFKEVAG